MPSGKLTRRSKGNLTTKQNRTAPDAHAVPPQGDGRKPLRTGRVIAFCALLMLTVLGLLAWAALYLGLQGARCYYGGATPGTCPYAWPWQMDLLTSIVAVYGPALAIGLLLWGLWSTRPPWR